eukprot:479040-Rhodomonas_salina.3
MYEQEITDTVPSPYSHTIEADRYRTECKRVRSNGRSCRNSNSDSTRMRTHKQDRETRKSGLGIFSLSCVPSWCGSGLCAAPVVRFARCTTGSELSQILYWGLGCAVLPFLHSLPHESDALVWKVAIKGRYCPALSRARVWCLLSGTELAYGATSVYAMCGTELAHGPTCVLCNVRY